MVLEIVKEEIFLFQVPVWMERTPSHVYVMKDMKVRHAIKYLTPVFPTLAKMVPSVVEKTKYPVEIYQLTPSNVIVLRVLLVSEIFYRAL